MGPTKVVNSIARSTYFMVERLKLKANSVLLEKSEKAYAKNCRRSPFALCKVVLKKTYTYALKLF